MGVINQILGTLATYRYVAIVPLAAVEGPIVTIVAGFLVSLGQLNFILAYFLIILGDTIGDCVYYSLGRFGRGVSPRFLALLGITEPRLKLAQHYFEHHPKKTFAVGKISHGVGVVPLFAAGLIKFPFGRFLFYNVLLTIVKSLLLLVIGYYFGRAAVNIKTYLDYSAVAGIIIGAGLYWTFIRYADKLERKND